MARTNNLNNFLTDVANSIRNKTGSQESIQASDFDTEIANIPTGGTSNLQSKDVSILTNGVTTITADEGYDGLSDVDVTVAVPTIDTSDATATAGNILSGKTAYISGGKTEGTMVDRSNTSIIPSMSQQSIPTGYHNNSSVASISDSDYYKDCLREAKLIVSGTEEPYIELDYIQSTGTQYINADYLPTGNSKYEFKYTDNTADGVMFGAYNTTWETGCGLYTNVQHLTPERDDWFHYYSNSNTHHSSNSSSVVEVDKGKISFNGVVSLNLSTKSFSITKPLYIFAGNMADNLEQPTSFKLYYFKIYDNDTLIRDFIPVKRKEDNEICLYDKVSETFFTNQGTGTFIAGPIKS